LIVAPDANLAANAPAVPLTLVLPKLIGFVSRLAGTLGVSSYIFIATDPEVGITAGSAVVCVVRVNVTLVDPVPVCEPLGNT
jgi:hypothetical protein